MKIARLATSSGVQYAFRRYDEPWVPLTALGLTAADVVELASIVDSLQSDKEDGEQVTDAHLLCPIVRPGKILAIGLNYADHIRETGATAPERPIVFAKYASALNDPTGEIVLDYRLTEQLDYEAELAVVIGRRARWVSASDALSYVLGYAVANDVSARDWQKRDGQLSRSKSMDTFCPIGPWITTRDEVADPQDLGIRSLVNGEQRQSSRTSEMIFGVSQLIEYLSRTMTLEPGDVILTGTPHGVGMAMQPPRYLQPGDVVRCEIEGLGYVENPVVAARQS